MTKIPELLGLSDQFKNARIKQGPHIIFHKSLEKRTWSQLRKALPFTFPGQIESDCTLGFSETMERLKINLGITEYDKYQVIHAIQHGPHPRVVYNRLFRHRGMPLGHFNASIINICQQAVSVIREQKAAVLNEFPDQSPAADYSDESALTTLTNTPVLSDVELSAPKTPSPETEGSDTPKDGGSSSTTRIPRTRASRLAETATAVKHTLATIAPSQDIRPSLKLSTNDGASALQKPARETSPLQLGKIKLEPAEGKSGLDGRIDPKLCAHGAEYEQRSIAECVNKGRRMAIAQQSVDEWCIRPLDQGFISGNTKAAAREKVGQEVGFLEADPQQQLRTSPQNSGHGKPVAVLITNLDECSSGNS
ncbi:hypothetical protein KVR01_002486 [Diaporthe batatas]|uniref:uncharacterized protein n=1 Tax=Diaporthe batatas TaxID=748121 RepID=UPI001D03E684|nr:uncharacterized protein KVR01_002486 [Diaporthe batatas]KAG8166797.1 hypothetical protein KVR01_002486 [Diaporthe batatas]